jgi:hypothetical protein
MGRRFDVVIDANKNATTELKMFRENGFQECFQQLYSH